VLHDSGNVRRPDIAAGTRERELRVIDPEQVEDRRAQVAHVHRFLLGPEKNSAVARGSGA